jgi:hypothetical protein
VDVITAVAELRSSVDRASGLRDAAVSRLEALEREVDELETEAEVLHLVTELFRQLIDREVTEGVKAVEELQTEGLRTVFSDQDLAVRADVEVSRGKVSVDLLTRQKLRDGTIIEGLTNDAFGGAVTTVQSVLMRVIVILRRGMRPMLVMDESLPAFDGGYVNNMGEFLSLVCERLGLDVLLVTHNPALVEAGDHAYRIVRMKAGIRFETIH